MPASLLVEGWGSEIDKCSSPVKVAITIAPLEGPVSDSGELGLRLGLGAVGEVEELGCWFS